MTASFETGPIRDTAEGREVVGSLPKSATWPVSVMRSPVALLALLALFTFSTGAAIPAGASSPASPSATWTRLSPSGNPTARDSASMAYDPALGDMVLFGGSANGSELNDTWTFNGTSWTELSPTKSPPARDGAAMAYDPAMGEMVLFGGEANSVNLSDTWTFNGTSWAQLSPPASPGARWFASMAHDSHMGEMVLFGGSGSTSDLSDTWTFNGKSWAQLSPTTSPSARDSSSMDYDPVTESMILFGGVASGSDLNDTWAFNGTTWTQLTPRVSPLARDSSTMAYDPTVGGMVLFGGEANSVDLSDTWTFVQVTVSLQQGTPNSATVTFGAGYSGHHLTVTNSTATVGYTEATSASSTDVVVSGTGAISASASLAPGTYTVSGSDSDANGDTGTWIFTLTVGQADQTITFTSTPPSEATVGATYNVTATGGSSGEAVTFSTTSVCTVSGSTVSFVGVGTCVIDANQAGNADYLSAPQVRQTVVVGKADQTITFTSTPPSDATVGATYKVTATGGSSGTAIMFRTNSVCAVSGSTVSFVGVGTCVIDANQAGNADYLSAPQVRQTVVVGKADQTITFTSTPPSDATVGATYKVTATGGPSGKAIMFRTNSVCAVSGPMVRFVSVGECVVVASQAGDADYLAAIQVQQTMRVGKGVQTITFTSKAPTDATVGATYKVSASGGASGEAVTFSTTSMCTVSGSTVHFIGVGKCVIDASQPGNADYLAAAQVSQGFSVGKAASKTDLKLSVAKVPYGHEQAERLSVTVTPQFAGPTPTGRVNIRTGGTVLCTASLSSGTGTCRLSPRELKARMYGLVAVFSGGANFKGSVSREVTLVVTKTK